MCVGGTCTLQHTCGGKRTTHLYMMSSFPPLYTGTGVKFRFRLSNELLQLLSHLADTLYILKCTLFFTSAWPMSGNAVGGSWYKTIWFSDKHDMNFQVATGLVYSQCCDSFITFFIVLGLNPGPCLWQASTLPLCYVPSVL